MTFDLHYQRAMALRGSDTDGGFDVMVWSDFMEGPVLVGSETYRQHVLLKT